ncbi:MAG: MFS transporter, partial [Propionibacteriaceae bacterium]|nr:MFS transporter [Propionibacteriaceae bacterium]
MIPGTEEVSRAHPPQAIRRARTGDLLVFAVNGFAFATWMSRVPDMKELL